MLYYEKNDLLKYNTYILIEYIVFFMNIYIYIF